MGLREIAIRALHEHLGQQEQIRVQRFNNEKDLAIGNMVLLMEGRIGIAVEPQDVECYEHENGRLLAQTEIDGIEFRCVWNGKAWDLIARETCSCPANARKWDGVTSIENLGRILMRPRPACCITREVVR